MKLLALISLAVLAIGAFAQDKPEPIAKKDLPKLAECTVCIAHGTPMGMEKPAAGVNYKGKAYYFCNAKEVSEFAKSPDMFIPLELPMALPDLQLTDLSGKKWDSDAFKGKLVLLDYWATWCKPCLALKPKLDKIRDQYKGQGFEVLSVSIDEKAADLEKFFKKNKWDNPVAHDQKGTWVELRVVAIPALYLVKDGQIVAVFRGNVDAKKISETVKSNLP
jgi:thiol-disulfide isomerase/thioredoxin